MDFDLFFFKFEFLFEIFCIVLASESETTTHPPILKFEKIEIHRIRRRIRHLICFSLIPRHQTTYTTQRDT